MSCCQHYIACWQYDECYCNKWEENERRSLVFKNSLDDNIYLEVVDDDNKKSLWVSTYISCFIFRIDYLTNKKENNILKWIELQ
jgi:hypothetical protein